MKMITEYLDHAITFERMAAEEDDPLLKARFEQQAAAYRKIAGERAAQYGLPAPSPPTDQTLTEAARLAAEEYANEQREIITKLRGKLN